MKIIKNMIKILLMLLLNISITYESNSEKIWLPNQDEVVINYMSQNKTVNWSDLAKQLNGKTPLQCRSRWSYCLDPNINHSNWTFEEDKRLIYFFNLLGPKWSKIKGFFIGRTEPQLKSRIRCLNKRYNYKENYLELDKKNLLPPITDIISQKNINEITLSFCNLFEKECFR